MVAPRFIAIALSIVSFLVGPPDKSAFARSPATTESKAAADLLPATVVAYAEIPDLAGAIRVVMDHPLRDRVESSPVVQAVIHSDDFQPALQLVGGFETTMGQPWRTAVGGLTDDGVSLAFDGASQGAALLVKCSDAAQLERFRRFLLAVVQAGQGKLMLQQNSYRGFTVDPLNDQAKLAIMDRWLLVTNDSDLGKSIVDRYLDGGSDSLSGKPKFAESQQLAGQADAFAYVDVKTIREAGVAPKLYSGKTENVVAEALFGGIQANLMNAPYATASLDVELSGLKLSLATPHQPEWESGREYFFGASGQDAAPPETATTESLLTLRTYRDLSQMWLRAPDLMTDRANEELAKADSTLTTLFSGLDFGKDVLGSLHPEMQLVVAKTDFDVGEVRPAIELPGFAIEFRMRNPDATQTEFRRVFQSLIGFLNIVGAMEGQPQLDQNIESINEAKLVIATYVPPRQPDELDAIPIFYNFSPTIAFAGDRMLISSTASLARALIESNTTAADPAESKTDQPNTIANLDAEVLQDVLRQNRAQLVAQNMLEKAHSPEQAETEIGVLFDLLSLFRGASIQLETDPEQLRLTTEILVKTE